jgi:hypothetical protein
MLRSAMSYLATNWRISVLDTANNHADRPRTPHASSAHAAQKPALSRALTLTRVDRRGRMGKRIAELRAIYVAALGGPDALSPIKRMRVDEAAQLKALAELARGDFMRDGKGSIDDIVRIERKASAAERVLGIVEQHEGRDGPTQTLQQYLAEKAAQKEGVR